LRFACCSSCARLRMMYILASPIHVLHNRRFLNNVCLVSEGATKYPRLLPHLLGGLPPPQTLASMVFNKPRILQCEGGPGNTYTQKRSMLHICAFGFWGAHCIEAQNVVVGMWRRVFLRGPDFTTFGSCVRSPHFRITAERGTRILGVPLVAHLSERNAF
jgi:hypothetical protein